MSITLYKCHQILCNLLELAFSTQHNSLMVNPGCGIVWVFLLVEVYLSCIVLAIINKVAINTVYRF